MEATHEDRLWIDNGWTARVVKNEDDEGWAVEMVKDGEPEPALVGWRFPFVGNESTAALSFR